MGTTALEDRLRTSLARRELHAAATEVIRGYGSAILLYIHAILQDASAADEAFSEFTERLWTHIGGFRGESSVKTWAYLLASSAAYECLRNPYRRRARPIEAAALSEVADEVRSTTRGYLRTDVKDRMARLRQSLDPEDRALLLLRVDQRFSWREIAQAMSTDGPVSEAAVRKRYERLKTRLRELARAEGILEEP